MKEFVRKLFFITVTELAFLVSGCAPATDVVTIENELPEIIEEVEEEPEPEVEIVEVHREWSILVYMGADNNLEPSAIEDFCEMERSRLNTDSVTVLVLLDRSPLYDTSNGNWSGTRLYELRTGREALETDFISEVIQCESLSLKNGKETKLNLSSSGVLSKVLFFMQSEYPAEHYGLIMWGHGTGWRGNDVEEQFKGFAFDDTTQTYMSLRQLGNVLSSVFPSKKLDFLGFDTCFGLELEILYELYKSVDIIVGSEGLVFASGWNYTRVFNLFDDCTQKTAEALCTGIVQQFSEQFYNSTRASIAAVKTEYIGKLFQSFDEYMKTVADFITARSVRDEILGVLYSNKSCEVERYCYGTENSDIYLDLYSASKKLNEYFGARIEGLEQKFEGLSELISQSFICNWASDRDDMILDDGKCTGGIGFFFSVLGAGGLLSANHPAAYIRLKTSEQIAFVRDSQGYVPCENTGASLLDKVFYTHF